jgi:hypothetical protein
MTENNSSQTMQQYCHNAALFGLDYFDAILRDHGRFPKLWQEPENIGERLAWLQKLWEDQRRYFLADDTRPAGARAYIGLPKGICPNSLLASESDVENGFIKPIMEELFGFAIAQNVNIELQGEAAEEARKAGERAKKRPDMIVFRDKDDRDKQLQRLAGLPKAEQKNGVKFCRAALCILDAKKFSKGLDVDEDEEQKRARLKEGASIADIHQLDRYLRGYDRSWGILSNGRSWRLMRQHEVQKHLRFDLVLFLENLRGREAGGEDLQVFTLFWNLFGPPAMAGGVLDSLFNESNATTRKIRDALRDNAHRATLRLAEGFWENRRVNDFIPDVPDQAMLDRLREHALTFLYRLLFILKAEAQNLLPMYDEQGDPTSYANDMSTQAIYKKICAYGGNLSDTIAGYKTLRNLFLAVDQGDVFNQVAAYNGGLFSAEANKELNKLQVTDQVLKEIFELLIYLDDDAGASDLGARQPIPYKDLDVRDLGDIYESLLEQRLILSDSGVDPRFVLCNQKGERKASGSYFTPDRLVEHLVRKTVMPLLENCKSAEEVLRLRILDPAMGSGHFLVKAVDVISEHLTGNYAPLEADAPQGDAEAERAYWRAQVAEHCIYGVDYNPMAVELAKVALWLHTARREKPLSFLNHHLKCGNSLVGVPLNRLANPGRNVTTWEIVPPPAGAIPEDERPPAAQGKGRKKRLNNDPKQLLWDFQIDSTLVSGIVASIKKILARPSDSPDDIMAKSKEYADAVYERLAAHRLLADLWCAQWFVADPSKEEDVLAYQQLYDRVKDICRTADDRRRLAALAKLGYVPGEAATHPFINKMQQVNSSGFGPRPFAFFHWQLEFPEVAFHDDGKPKNSFGFDAVVGNPPWDKIKPAKRDFYGAINPAVANAQGASLNQLITRMENEDPTLINGWSQYESSMKKLAEFLADSSLYHWQTVTVAGKKTGGDPDLYRYFIERADQCLGEDGRMGLVVPGMLWQGDGSTGVRQLLIQHRCLESLYVFENYRKWAFSIDSRFKFTAFVARRGVASAAESFPAAFMLRNAGVLDGLLPERVLQLNRQDIEALSPHSLALLDFRGEQDARLAKKLHEQHPALGSEESGWKLRYRRELDMTNHARYFKYPQWLARRGFTLVRPVREADGSWRQEFLTPLLDANGKWQGRSVAAQLPPERMAQLPTGGEYWVAAPKKYYEKRDYSVLRDPLISGQEAYIAKEDETAIAESRGRLTPCHFRIVPDAIYTALYEGRMVHNFNHAQKKYLRGEGRKAIWREQELDAQILSSRIYVNVDETAIAPELRLGFCDVTGATNERTFLSALITGFNACGNKVPTLSFHCPNTCSLLSLSAIANSFVFDFLVRYRVSTTMNWVYVTQLPIVRCDSEKLLSYERAICERVVRLSCTTPELAAYWNEVFPAEAWTYASAERDPWGRARLRAELDAIVADLYGLSVRDYALVLASFPLLDRNWPALPGDAFVTEAATHETSLFPAAQRGQSWDENSGGIWELTPRSFITRDYALLTYITWRREHGDQDAFIPERLDEWYRDHVGIDPAGPQARFRIGDIKDLEERVRRAKELGALPYVPSTRGLSSEETEEIAD